MLVVTSELQRSHLQKALQEVGDAVVLGGIGIIAQKLTANNLCTEVGELDPER